MVARRVSEIAVFVALSLTSGFAMLAVPNVELMTLSVFCAGVFLGVRKGMLVGVMSMALFTTFNPYGPAPLPLGIAQILMMGTAGLVGGCEKGWLYSRIDRAGDGRSAVGVAALAVTGAVLTLVYDLVTNLALAAVMTESMGGFWAVVISGSALSGVHVISNVVIFSAVGWSAVRALAHWKRAGRGSG